MDALAKADRAEPPRESKGKRSNHRIAGSLCQHVPPWRSDGKNERSRHDQASYEDENEPNILPFPAMFEFHRSREKSIKQPRHHDKRDSCAHQVFGSTQGRYFKVQELLDNLSSNTGFCWIAVVPRLRLHFDPPGRYNNALAHRILRNTCQFLPTRRHQDHSEPAHSTSRPSAARPNRSDPECWGKSTKTLPPEAERSSHRSKH